ncbi:ankyrin [Xylariaceae sp. AK1471]|nr:ankyrin [Xylariaceae sp. AK1471]
MAALLQPSSITEEEWDCYKDVIISLYLGHSDRESERVEEGKGEIKGKTLPELAESMRVMHGFTASVSQFEARLKKWNARKNLKVEEWKPVLESLGRLPRATKSRVIISDRVVPNTTISRARRYHKQKSRIVTQLPTPGPSASPSIPQQVRIEVQEPNGSWVQLVDAASTSLLQTSSSSMAEYFGEVHDLQLYGASPVPIMSTGLSLSVRHSQPLIDVGNYRSRSPQDSGQVMSIQMGIASTWLQTLPSRCIINCVRKNWVNPFQNEQNQRIMTPADVCRAQFIQFLLPAIMNGECKPYEIPKDVLDGCLGPDGALNSLLLSCFKVAPEYVTATLASSFFQASMRHGKRDIITQFLEKGLIHANDSILFDSIIFNGFRRRLTPLESAAGRGDEALVELLLSLGADPNKHHHPGNGEYEERGYEIGALRSLLQACCPTYQPSLAIVRKLFEAGAEVYPTIRGDIFRVKKEVASCILLHIRPSRHAEYFSEGFWTKTILYGEDIQAANLVNRVVADCVEQHNAQCMSDFQQNVDQGLRNAAAKGRAETFLAISPHSSHSHDHDEKLLSASIRGKHPVIINSIMLRRPNINPRPHSLYDVHLLEGPPLDNRPTSPLAESIRTGNNKLIDIFLSASVFESLHNGGRFEAALEAAAEIGAAELLDRLLESCPDLESHNMERALHMAVANGYGDLALTLVERGASVYVSKEGLGYYASSCGPVTPLAIEKGNSSIARTLLNIGEKNIEKIHNDNIDRQLLFLVDPSIAEDYLSSYSCGFRYEIGSVMTASDFGPDKKQQRHSHTSNSIYRALKDKKVCDLMLVSKLATVQLLTVCLASAVSQNNPTLAQDLIERGADPANQIVRTCAVRWGPSLLPLLLEAKKHQRTVVTKGLGTETLKEAIRQGPSKAYNVSLLVESGLVDIFDVGDCGQCSHDADEFDHDPYNMRLTPLGVAIREAEFSPQFGYDIVKLLLGHGCDPDSIVNFATEYGPPINQTAMLEAIDIGDQELVKLLIQYGAQINIELRHMIRRTPLQKAAEEGDIEIVRLLLQHGANVNAKPYIAMGGTAVQFAAISGNCELAAELLDHGALLHSPPSKIGGRWPIEGAAEHGRFDMIQFLWKANEETLYCGDGENGFQERNFKKAMRLARENNHLGCNHLIAELANLPITATDVPPVVSPIYIDWPPPEWSVD